MRLLPPADERNKKRKNRLGKSSSNDNLQIKMFHRIEYLQK